MRWLHLTARSDILLNTMWHPRNLQIIFAFQLTVVSSACNCSASDEEYIDYVPSSLCTIMRAILIHYYYVVNAVLIQCYSIQHCTDKLKGNEFLASSFRCIFAILPDAVICTKALQRNHFVREGTEGTARQFCLGSTCIKSDQSCNLCPLDCRVRPEAL